MSKLHILIREHSDYDIFDYEIVGIVDQKRIADAFIEVGSFNHYWSHSVVEIEVGKLDEHTDVHLSINEWLDPAANPLCECGHRLMHHRRKNGTGSCKWNNQHHHDPKQRHKCKGFRLAEKQPLLATEKETE